MVWFVYHGNYGKTQWTLLLHPNGLPYSRRALVDFQVLAAV